MMTSTPPRPSSRTSRLRAPSPSLRLTNFVGRDATSSPLNQRAESRMSIIDDAADYHSNAAASFEESFKRRSTSLATLAEGSMLPLPISPPRGPSSAKLFDREDETIMEGIPSDFPEEEDYRRQGSPTRTLSRELQKYINAPHYSLTTRSAVARQGYL